MKWTTESIKKSFSGRLIGNLQMQKAVIESVVKLPDDVIKYVVRNVWFIASPEDSWAFTFRGSDIKGQHLVVISDELLRQSKNDIEFTIIHEIGHVMLGHRNSMGAEQSKREIKIQEKEAHEFAKKYQQ